MPDDIKIGKLSWKISARIGFVVMLAVGLRGLLEIGKGIVVSMPHFFEVEVDKSTHAVEAAIGCILDGFEFLLLAPLAFVIVVSVGRYLQALLMDLTANEAEHQLHRVKGLIISLMISIVATDLVKRFVGQADVNFRALIFGGSLIFLFIIYYILLVGVRRIGPFPVPAANAAGPHPQADAVRSAARFGEQGRS
jgi:hypothetical protein